MSQKIKVWVNILSFSKLLTFSLSKFAFVEILIPVDHFQKYRASVDTGAPSPSTSQCLVSAVLHLAWPLIVSSASFTAEVTSPQGAER